MRLPPRQFRRASAGALHPLQYNLDGYAATLLSEGLLAVADAQMQLMWQAQRAQDVCDAFFNAVRSHMHRLEAEVSTSPGCRGAALG